MLKALVASSVLCFVLTCSVYAGWTNYCRDACFELDSIATFHDTLRIKECYYGSDTCEIVTTYYERIQNNCTPPVHQIYINEITPSSSCEMCTVTFWYYGTPLPFDLDKEEELFQLALLSLMTNHDWDDNSYIDTITFVSPACHKLNKGSIYFPCERNCCFYKYIIHKDDYFNFQFFKKYEYMPHENGVKCDDDPNPCLTDALCPQCVCDYFLYNRYPEIQTAGDAINSIPQPNVEKIGISVRFDGKETIFISNPYENYIERMEIYDQLGNLIFNYDLMNSKSEQQFKLKPLPSGFYLYKLYGDINRNGSFVIAK